MARLATATELAADGRRPLTLADVPAEFLPSNWRYWLDDSDESRFDLFNEDEVYGRRPLFEALERRSDNYRRWLADNDLVNDIGQPAKGWTTGDLAAWEDR